MTSERMKCNIWRACRKASSDYAHMSHMGGAASLPSMAKATYGTRKRAAQDCEQIVIRHSVLPSSRLYT